MKYDLLRVIHSSRWLMAASDVKQLITAVTEATPEHVQATIEARGPERAQPDVVGSTAIIQVCGPITYRSSFFSRYFGASTIETMQAQLRAALADDSIANIVLRVDSPGGVVDMVPEFAAEIFKARGRKPMITVVDTMMGSAASWIGLQADQVIAPGSAQLGSIGVYLLHMDVSKMMEEMGVKMTFISAGEGKVEGNAYEPLGDATKARFQEDVDEVYNQFVGSVARARKVTAAAVRNDWKAYVYSGDKALGIKMLDKKGNFTDVVERLSKQRAGTTRATVAEALADLSVEDALVGIDLASGEAQGAVVAIDADGTSRIASNEETAAALAAQREADEDYVRAAIAIAERSV